MADHRLCSVISTHAMYSAEWRSRGRAKKNVRVGRSIVVWCGPEEQLAQGNGPSIDVPANEVGVQRFKKSGRRDMARQDAVAETGREALDLCFDALRHIKRGPVGHVTVGPGDVLSLRRARGIEQRRLREQDKWPVRMPVLPDCKFGFGDFFHCSAQMDRSGAGALSGLPRNGSGKGVVQLEGPRAVPETSQILLELTREPVAGKVQQLARADVANQDRMWRKVFKRGDRRMGVNASAERGEVSCQSIRSGLRPAARHRPAHGMGGGGQHDSARCAERRIQRHDGVRGDSGQEGADTRENVPNRAMRNGCAGKWTSGRSAPFAIWFQCSASGPKMLRQRLPSLPNTRSASSRSRSSVKAVPSSKGWASGAGAWTHSSPCLASGRVEKNGEPAAIAWIAEPKSC